MLAGLEVTILLCCLCGWLTLHSYSGGNSRPETGPVLSLWIHTADHNKHRALLSDLLEETANETLKANSLTIM